MTHPFLAALHDRARRPLVMGILNVTPDSFSDGARYATVESALNHGLTMLAQGADIIDVGAESTRPGAEDVPPSLQLTRALPALAALHAAVPQAALSIDTRSAEVAKAALDAGACVINDVSALRDDPHMVDVAAQSGAGVVLMHRRGDARTMQARGGPHYTDLISEVSTFLLERAAFAQQHGIAPERIILDPGIGFGKRFEDNVALLAALPQLAAHGFPILIGASRKAFLGCLLQEQNVRAAKDPGERLYGSLACAAWSALSGAALIRVHDVRETAELCTVLRAFRNQVT